MKFINVKILNESFHFFILTKLIRILFNNKEYASSWIKYALNFLSFELVYSYLMYYKTMSIFNVFLFSIKLIFGKELVVKFWINNW